MLVSYASVNVMHQGSDPLQADPGDSDIWQFLMSKSSPSFVPLCQNPFYSLSVDDACGWCLW